MNKMLVGCASYLKRSPHLNGVRAFGNENVRHVIWDLTSQKRFYAKGGQDCCDDSPQSKGRQVESWPRPFDQDHPGWKPECPKTAPPRGNDFYRIKMPEVEVPPLPKGTAKPMLSCVKLLPCGGKPPPDPPVCPKPPKKPFPWIYPIIFGTIATILGLLYQYYLWRMAKEKAGDLKPVWRPRQKARRPPHPEDLPACVQYLIIGAGTAAWSAYRAIMEHDPTAKVFFISKEDTFPYKRPPISKQMWYNGQPPDIKTLNYLDEGIRKTMYYSACKAFMDPVKFFNKKTGPAVAIGLGWCVDRVDADDHAAYVTTNCGEKAIYYERCLIAVGANAKNLSFYKNSPKFVRERITVLRTVRNLEIAYRKVREAKHVTVIGGGPLGSELAYYLGSMHKNWVPQADEEYVPPQVLHIIKDKGILSGIIPEYLGEWATEKIRCQGVTVMPNTQVYDAFENDGRLELTLSNGKSIITDYVIVGIGVTPRVDIAKKSNLEIDYKNKGIMVNTELEARTHLYAAGDVASIYTQWKDTRQRMEHYINAEEQGYIAGSNMAGYWMPCNIDQRFWFKLGSDIQMEAIGEVGACLETVGLFKPCDKIEDEKGRLYEEKMGEYDRPCYKETASYRHRYRRGMVFYIRNDIIVGMMFWNFPPIEERERVVHEMLRAQPTYEDINLIAELLGFPGIECIVLPKEMRENLICIDKSKSLWMEYEDYDKIGELSKVQVPETVQYVNKPLA